MVKLHCRLGVDLDDVLATISKTLPCIRVNHTRPVGGQSLASEFEDQDHAQIWRSGTTDTYTVEIISKQQITRRLSSSDEQLNQLNNTGVKRAKEKSQLCP